MPEVEQPLAAVPVSREAGMLAKDIRRPLVSEGITPAHPPRYLGDDPPVRAGVAGKGEQRALAADRAFAVGDGAVLLAPCRRWELYVGEAAGVGIGDTVGNRHEGAFRERLAHAAGVRQRNGRIGRHDPQRLDPAFADCAEEIDRLEAGLGRHTWRGPEAAHRLDVFGREIPVGGQSRSEPADLSSAHGVGLAGDRERPRAGVADPSGGEVKIDDRVDLVGAVDRLVDALAEQRDRAFGPGEQIVEGAQIGGGEIAGAGGRPQVAALPQSAPEALGRHDVRLQEFAIEKAFLAAMGEQAVHQGHVAAGAQLQVKVGAFGRFGAARIDDYELRPAGRPCGDDALVDDRVTPGGVGADQHDKIGLIDIVVGDRHHIFAERAHVAGDRARHAQPAVGVDIGRADEALHQLVGDVIVLGQQLAGDVEGDAVRPMPRDRVGELASYVADRPLPTHPLAADFRMQQPAFEADRFA